MPPKPDRLETISKLLAEHNDTMAALIEQAIDAVRQHGRSGTINLIIKVQHDKEDPNLLEVFVQEKAKQPKSSFSDITKWDETSLMLRFRIAEETGQMTLDQSIN